MANSKKVFNEEEVGRLLQRAIQRQEADEKHDFDLHHGLTLDEVERIASDAGIDPKYIRQALYDLNVPPDTTDRLGVWGAPAKFEHSIEVPGHLDDTIMADMLAEIRSTYKKNRGNFEKLDKTFEWIATPSGGLSRIAVRADPWDVNTMLTVKADISQSIFLHHFFALFFPLFFGFVFSAGIGAPIGLPIGIGIAGILYFMARWSVSKHHAKEAKRCKSLLDRLAAVAEQHQDENNSWNYDDAGTREARPPIDLDSAEGYEMQKTHPAGRKKTRS